MKNQVKIATLPYLTLEYKKPIVYLNFNKSVLIDKKMLVEMLEVRNKLVCHEKHLLLTTYNAVVDFTKEARELAAASEFAQTSIAHAVVIKRLGQRLVTSNYKQIEKPHYPLEIFSERGKALKWLSGFIREMD